MGVEIKFCGAAGVVTGSCYLVTCDKGAFLVDCGLFQGTKTVRELNYGDFGFDPKDVSFVLLTHAHIDHSGLLPKLFKQGFAGKVYATEATKDLLAYMLPDSAHIQETEVRRLNDKKRQRGEPSVMPIYGGEDVEKCLEAIEPLKINGWIDLPFGVRARFWNAGHILGSASIEVTVPDGGAGTHLLFSGDLGPENKMFHAAPESPAHLDYLIVETTYGGRPRLDRNIDARRRVLQQEILDAVAARGNILIPAFAVERTQELLLDLDFLMEEGKIPSLPIFIDSPLATKVTGVFERYRHELEDLSGDKTPFKGRNIRYVESVEESKKLNLIKSGAIIMAASGMCEAGRIRHHLKNNLWSAANTVLFVGYQAEGTLGQFIQQGTASVRIHGQEVDVKARIRTIEGYSAHADQTELVDWITARLPIRQKIFLTHGTIESRDALRKILVEDKELSPDMFVSPFIDDVYMLGGAGAVQKLGTVAPRLTVDLMTPKDWHNDYARFVLDFAQHLRSMPDAASRLKLLAEFSNRLTLISQESNKRRR